MSWLRRNLVMIVALLVLVYLFVPIGYTIAFSFNNAGRSNLDERQQEPACRSEQRSRVWRGAGVSVRDGWLVPPLECSC